MASGRRPGRGSSCAPSPLLRSLACAAPLLLLLLHLSCGATAQDASGGASPALLLTDPEKVFDVLSSGNNTVTLSVAGKLLTASSKATLSDGNSSTYQLLPLPTAKASPVKVMEFKLKASEEIAEITLRISAALSSKSNYTDCLSKAYWLDNKGRKYLTVPNRPESPDPRASRINYNIPAELNAPAVHITSAALYLAPGSCAIPAGADKLNAAVTELLLGRPPSLEVFGSSSGLVDDHYHPCSFSQFCNNVSTITAEQQRNNVAAAMVFGLQHNLVRGASQWLAAVLGKGEPLNVTDGEALDETPFHYNDLAALPSNKTGALPGLDKINEARARAGLPNITFYAGWPMFPTTLADWHTFSDYAALVAANVTGVKGHIFPYVSSMRMDQTMENYTLYGVCSKDNVTGLFMNEALLRAMDTLFPGAVYGAQEYNLNKTAVIHAHSYPPVLDAQWAACMRPMMSYLSATSRPIGFHADLKPYDRNWEFFLMAKEFKDTIIIWDHGGIAPEVDKRLSAKDHIAAMEYFLSTAPLGRRYVDISWNAGFYLRLDRTKLGDVEWDSQAQQEVPRDWVAHCQAYMDFINKRRSVIMFGSDQVALDYPTSLTMDQDGNIIINRPSYGQATTYGAQLRQEVGMLYNAMQVAGPAHALSKSVVDRIYSLNARALLSKPRPYAPGTEGERVTGLSPEQARKWVHDLIVTQWSENLLIAGNTAPDLEDFMPKDLQDLD